MTAELPALESHMQSQTFWRNKHPKSHQIPPRSSVVHRQEQNSVITLELQGLKSGAVIRRGDLHCWASMFCNADSDWSWETYFPTWVYHYRVERGKEAREPEICRELSLVSWPEFKHRHSRSVMLLTSLRLTFTKVIWLANPKRNTKKHKRSHGQTHFWRQPLLMKICLM